MGKREAAKFGLLGWITVLTLLFGFLLAASWGRSMLGADIAPLSAPPPAVGAENVVGADSPASMAAGSGTSAVAAVSAAPEKTPSGGNEKPFSLPGFQVLDPAIEKARSQERQAVRDAVARETVEESVQNLLIHDVLQLFSPHWRSLLHMSPDCDAVTLCEGLQADPRIAKLLHIVRYGSQSEVEILYDELRKAIDTVLFKFPLTQPIGEPPMPTVMDPWGGNASPMLLAAFPPSVEHLQLLVDMAGAVDMAHQEVLAQTWPDPVGRPENLSTQASTVLAYHVDQVLSRLADEWVNIETLPLEQRAALDSYLQFREEQRALTTVAIEDMAAHDLAEPEALGILEEPALLDSYRWRLANDLGRYKQPQENHTAQEAEREVLALANAFCAAANLQPMGDSP